MPKNKLSADQHGIAHLGLVVLLLVVVSAGGFAFYRVKNANDSKSNTVASQSNPSNDEDTLPADDEASLDDSESAAAQTTTDNTATDEGADNVTQ